MCGRFPAHGGLSFTAKEYEMIAQLEKLFTKSIKLEPDLWLYILLAVVAVAFVVTLVVGLLCGEFRTIKTRMRGVVASPDKTLAEMKLMPASVKKQYKTARMANARPSDFLSQRDLVEAPYRASLISKIWIVTFVATVICTLIAFFITPLSLLHIAEDDVAGLSGLSFSQYIAPLVVLIVGALLTLVGAIVGKCSYNGAVKLYAKFVPAVDGEAKPAVKGQAQPEAAQQQAAYAQAEQEPVQAYAAEPQESVEYAAEQVAEPYVQQEAYVEQPAEPQVDDRAAAREEAMARMRAEQEAAQARAAQEEQARREAQARAAQEQQERLARMEAARAAQAQAQAQAQTAAPAGTSSADDVIARIEKIDREGAPRETMREVATLLQKERAKPENKTPEQQKKLNEALSKLLKAMSAASRK